MIHPTNQVNRFIGIDAHKHCLGIDGLTTPQLVRKGLMKLRMGEKLTHIVRGGVKRPAATPQEALALTVRRLATKPPAAVIPPAAGGIDFTCQHIGGWRRYREIWDSVAWKDG
jgi:hypothetical protein